MKMYTDISIPKESLKEAKIGQKVFVKIDSWKDINNFPIGKIIKILGRPGENNTEMQALAIEKGFNQDLKDDTEREATGKT